jgi:hypothetical protein
VATRYIPLDDTSLVPDQTEAWPGQGSRHSASGCRLGMDGLGRLAPIGYHPVPDLFAPGSCLFGFAGANSIQLRICADLASRRSDSSRRGDGAER